jgi:hypothetical protein
MFDVLFIVDVLLIPFSTLSESKKIIKFCSVPIFSTISSVSSIASGSGVNVDAISPLTLDENITITGYKKYGGVNNCKQ